jgi:hypothetical protein
MFNSQRFASAAPQRQNTGTMHSQTPQSLAIATGSDQISGT